MEYRSRVSVHQHPQDPFPVNLAALIDRLKSYPYGWTLGFIPCTAYEGQNY